YVPDEAGFASPGARRLPRLGRRARRERGRTGARRVRCGPGAGTARAALRGHRRSRSGRPEASLGDALLAGGAGGAARRTRGGGVARCGVARRGTAWGALGAGSADDGGRQRARGAGGGVLGGRKIGAAGGAARGAGEAVTRAGAADSRVTAGATGAVEKPMRTG